MSFNKNRDPQPMSKVYTAIGSIPVDFQYAVP